MKIIIDGKINKSIKSIHDKLALELDFGPYYGGNLSALWDMLSTEVERPFEICFVNVHELENLGNDFDRLIAVLKRTEQHDIESNCKEKFKLIIEK